MTSNFLILRPEVQQLAIDRETTEDWGDANRLSELANQRSGERYNLAIQAAASDRTAICYDLGSNPQTVDHLAIARADLLQASVIDALILRGSDSSFNAPTSVSGLTAWFDGNQGITLSSGVVTTWADRTGGYSATQGTTANMPIQSRFDNSENLTLQSQALNSASWTKTRSSVSPNVTTDPISGLSTVDILVEDTSASTTHYLIPAVGFTLKPSTSYRFSCYAKHNGRNIALRFDNAWSGNPYAYFNLQTGAVSAVGSGVSATIEDIGDGWYRVSATCSTAASPGTAYPSVYLVSGSTNQSYTGDGISAAYVTRIQFNEAVASTDYIETSTLAKVRGINGNRCLRFDGSNDYLSANFIGSAFSGTDKAISIFMAFRSNAASATIASMGRSSSATPQMRWHQNGAYVFATTDDAAASKSQSAGTSGYSASVWSHVSSGTAASDYINGTLIGSSGYDVDLGARTLDRFTIGALGTNSYSAYSAVDVAEIIVYNRAVTSDERQSIEAYLASKYTSTPLVVDYDFEPNCGVNGDDYINLFATSDEYRYFWFEAWSTSNKFAHSKLYIGQSVDLGETIDSISCKKPVDANDSFESDSGAVDLSKGKDSLYRVSVNFKGVTNDQIVEFSEKISSVADIRKGVFLCTVTNHQILDGKKTIHARLVRSLYSERFKDDYNALYAEFEELPA